MRTPYQFGGALLALALCFPGFSRAQTNTVPAAAAVPPAQIDTDLRAALLGEWTGFLEYRDYSEPATSQKRVQLPTWLSITAEPEGLRFHYIYDDGPNKVIDSQNTVVLNAAAGTYNVLTANKPAEAYSVAGFDHLRQGRGELVLTGKGEDSGKPAEQRITMTVRRNILVWLLEARPAGSAEPFAFRHRYVFTRAIAPKLTPTR